MYDVSPRKRYVTKNRLDAQIEATGNSIKDIKAVIMGHLRKLQLFVRLIDLCLMSSPV